LYQNKDTFTRAKSDDRGHIRDIQGSSEQPEKSDVFFNQSYIIILASKNFKSYFYYNIMFSIHKVSNKIL